MTTPDIAALLNRCITARLPLISPHHDNAVRLFNGFAEGLPTLSIDLYARTVVIHDYTKSDFGDDALTDEALKAVQKLLPWVTAAVVKVRHAKQLQTRNGRLTLGQEKDVAKRVRENGVAYAVAPMAQRDVGLYLDTRNLREWLKKNLSGARVLNTFAYTGSLGVAALAGGAREVIHTDMNKALLDVAKTSYSMNGFEISRSHFKVGDFFDVMGKLKREKGLFDCALVDPPYLSVTEQGRVELEKEGARVLNRVRPLIADGGRLIVVNNAVFLSGAEFMKQLEALCADGYSSIEETIAVADDAAGFSATRVGAFAVDPAPFNHSTKIAVLRVKRKDGRTK